MTVIMRVIGFAGNAPCPIYGQWLKSFDFEADEGRGFGTFTADPRDAKHFANLERALRFWRQPSLTHPWRDDGQLNRPLTCTTVTFDRIDDNGDVLTGGPSRTAPTSRTPVRFGFL